VSSIPSAAAAGVGSGGGGGDGGGGDKRVFGFIVASWPSPFGDLVTRRELWRPLLGAVVLMALQQLGGRGFHSSTRPLISCS